MLGRGLRALAEDHLYLFALLVDKGSALILDNPPAEQMADRFAGDSFGDVGHLTVGDATRQIAQPLSQARRWL